jgi:hypothetical protein
MRPPLAGTGTRPEASSWWACADEGLSRCDPVPVWPHGRLHMNQLGGVTGSAALQGMWEVMPQDPEEKALQHRRLPCAGSVERAGGAILPVLVQASIGASCNPRQEHPMTKAKSTKRGPMPQDLQNAGGAG